MKTSTPSEGRALRPQWLRVIPGGKRDPVTDPGLERAPRNATAFDGAAGDPAFLDDLDDSEGGGCLDRGGREGDPLREHDEPDHLGEGRRSRPPKPKFIPSPEHWTFARSVVSTLPGDGFLLFISVNPPPAMPFEVVLDALCSAFDIWDCAHYTVSQRGKRGRMHAHSIVYTRDPTRFQRDLKSWMKENGINPAATDVQAVTGCGNFFFLGRGHDKLTWNVAKVCEYSTRTANGGHVRPRRSDTRARGLFTKPRNEFVQPDDPESQRPPGRTCHECGGPLPSHATKRRRWCAGACKVSFCRWRKSNQRERWRLKLRGRSPTG